MNKEKLKKIAKKYTVADLARISCGCLLAVILILVIAGSGNRWWLALAFSCAVFITFEINAYAVKKYVGKSLLYALEYVLLLVFCMLVPNNYLSTVYSIILVDFYLHNSIKSNAVFGGLSYLAYAVSIIFTAFVIETEVDWVEKATSVLGEFIVFLLVFTITNMLVLIMRKNKEIAERESKLQEAYDSLKEMTEIEERNRIAKQIHDTTGHSITTIIMQTEAAKLQIDTAPDEAKNKIISANQQAVKALEELRMSVRVLSGGSAPFDLEANIDKTIAETTEGTGINVRGKYSDLPDIDGDEAFFIYSSLKEGLNNGIRHGKANAFFFELKVTDGKIKFLLSDNGKGSSENKLGFGLKSMKENAEKLGGKVEFVSTAGEGFEIRMTLPLKEREND